MSTATTSQLAASVPGHRPALPEALSAAVVPLVVCLGLAIAGQVVMEPLFGEYNARVARQACIFIVAAVSLNVVNGFTGQFSMGHAGFMAVGGYVASFVSYYGSMLMSGTADRMASPMLLGVQVPLTAGHALMLAGLVAGGLVASVLGLLVGLPSLRLRGDYLAIVTLGFGEIVRVMLELSGEQRFSVEQIKAMGLKDWLHLPVGGALGFSGIPGYADTFWVVLIAAITCLVAFRLKRSSTGRALLSVREDEIAARAMGINLTAYKVRAFVFSAFFAGVAGGLLAHSGVPFKPDNAGFAQSFEIIIMVVLGGLGSISGAVLAAIILTALPEILRSVSDYRLIIYALLLITMMLVRPKGLFGVREVWEMWEGRQRRKAGAATGVGGASRSTSGGGA